ncbi:hypothetical protein P4H39_19850 [Paenibacillus lautus]|uniref:hypothetical protein n=1 Tax=Paenibacillus lautus TaxID=1401 RepID=UPI002DB74F9C|nr:hypothetical protein [Paenibacillus lautus]MEC0204864.1 hypothetical protein [Paenibacillus lautus]
MIHEVNEWISLEESRQQREAQDRSDDDDSGSGHSSVTMSDSDEKQPKQIELTNEGEFLLDVTCAPADIAYPTDLPLLNQAREKLETIIDTHEPDRGKTLKPRTYRERARKAYLAVAKQRRVKPRAMRKAFGRQLRFVARDLRIVTQLVRYVDKFNDLQRISRNKSLGIWSVENYAQDDGFHPRGIEQ